MFTKTINEPLLQVFKKGGAVAVGFKGEATLPLSMKESLICM